MEVITFMRESSSRSATTIPGEGQLSQEKGSAYASKQKDYGSEMKWSCPAMKRGKKGDRQIFPHIVTRNEDDAFKEEKTDAI